MEGDIDEDEVVEDILEVDQDEENDTQDEDLVDEEVMLDEAQEFVLVGLGTLEVVQDERVGKDKTLCFAIAHKITTLQD